jgi:hypothetical protein
MTSSKNQSTSGPIATTALASANPPPEAQRPGALIPSSVDQGRSSVHRGPARQSSVGGRSLGGAPNVLASMSGRRPELSGILKTPGYRAGSRF